MQQDDNRSFCALCGARLDLDHNVIPTVAFDGREPGPTWRVVATNGREVHRCRVHPHDTAPNLGVRSAMSP
jgi:hypothetical protein